MAYLKSTYAGSDVRPCLGDLSSFRQGTLTFAVFEEKFVAVLEDLEEQGMLGPKLKVQSLLQAVDPAIRDEVIRTPGLLLMHFLFVLGLCRLEADRRLQVDRLLGHAVRPSMPAIAAATSAPFPPGCLYCSERLHSNASGRISKTAGVQKRGNLANIPFIQYP